MNFLDSVGNAVLDRSPDELIVALFVAGALALILTGLFILGRRKVRSHATFAGGLILVASILSMVGAAGYVDSRTGVSRDRRRSDRPNSVPVREPRRAGASWTSGLHMVTVADSDRDGRLTPEEVARFVREADADGDGSVDFREIDRLVTSRVRDRFAEAGRRHPATADDQPPEPPRDR
jgi:hypothetical protein